MAKPSSDIAAMNPRNKKSAKEKKSKAEEVEVIEPELIADLNKAQAPVEDSKAIAATDPTARYLAEIRRYPLLSKEEEKRLALKYYDEGDAKAAEALVTANLRFVVKVAAEYSKFGAKLIDLVQEGNLGLMHAVKEFNPYKGVRLITYAVWWIRGYIQEYLMRQYSMVRIGTTASQRKLFYQLQRSREELEKLGYEEAVAKLSSKLDVSEKDVRMMTKRMQGRDVSLDAPLSDSGGATFMDLQEGHTEESVEDQLAHHQELVILEENIAKVRPDLNEREEELLDKRLLADNPMTLQEIADQYGVTREAVRQMEARVIKKIREQVTG